MSWEIFSLELQKMVSQCVHWQHILVNIMGYKTHQAIPTNRNIIIPGAGEVMPLPQPPPPASDSEETLSVVSQIVETYWTW